MQQSKTLRKESRDRSTWQHPGSLQQVIFQTWRQHTPTLIILSDLLLATRSHNLSINWSVFWSNVAARLLFFVPSEQVSNHGRRTPGPSWMKHWNEELKQETIRDMMYWQKLFCCSKNAGHWCSLTCIILTSYDQLQGLNLAQTTAPDLIKYFTGIMHWTLSKCQIYVLL